MSDLSDQMGVLARQAQAWAEHAGEALRAAFGAPTERDRLANLISDAASAVDPGDPGSAHAVADAVLDAGYQRHGARAGGRAVSDHVLAQVCQDGDEMVAVCKCGVKRYVFVHNNDGSDAVADLNEHIADHVHRSFLDPLTTLRAEVIEARDEARIGEITEVEATLNWVLDLIDKRMEAGQ